MEKTKVNGPSVDVGESPGWRPKKDAKPDGIRTRLQAIVTRYGLTPETVDDVRTAKKDTLRRAKMLDFVEVSESLKDVGGFENLKR